MKNVAAFVNLSHTIGSTAAEQCFEKKKNTTALSKGSKNGKFKWKNGRREESKNL